LKTNRHNLAYDFLYERIISHKLEPGTPIVEQEISSMLGISRTPVREALRLLEAEGLIRHIPARGAYVSSITTQDVEEIFSLREILEIGALRIGISRMSDAEIEEVEKVLLALDENCKDVDFFNSDRILHELIVTYSGNRRLVNFINMINAQIERIRHISALRPQRLEKSKTEHLAIINAIKKRDIEAASKLLYDHIENVKRSSLDVLSVMGTK
jgi:DNA-binding GntR family transcriptional regulator